MAFVLVEHEVAIRAGSGVGHEVSLVWPFA